MSFGRLQAQVTNTGMVDAYDTLEKGKLTIGGYIDAYLSYDMNRPIDSERPYFVSSNRHGEFNINLSFLEFRYKNDNVRAHLVPGFGTYMNANYAQEKGALKFLLEANAGVLISKKRSIWLDAGVLPSPYSNESAISRDHLSYSRSLASEYVPYYLSGIKLSLPLSKKINTYWYLINGWQVIHDNNKSLAFGSQVEYRPCDKLLLNWDTYIGDESSITSPDYRTRYFSDLYAIYNPDGKLSMTSCIYFGRQEKVDSMTVRSYGDWWQANFQLRGRISQKSSLSARIEYFDDPKSILIKPITETVGFNCMSYSLCYNFKVRTNALFRLESRYFVSSGDVFLNQYRNPINDSLQFFSSLAIWF